MDSRASRCAIWKLHAPPSREANINPNPKKGGYPAPHRVTFLTGPNRDFPKRRRHLAAIGEDSFLVLPSIGNGSSILARSTPTGSCLVSGMVGDTRATS